VTWTCQKCGKNHGDRRVEEELKTKEEIAGDTVPGENGEPVIQTKQVPGWECDRCGNFHPVPEGAPVSTENSIEAVTREIAENEIDETNSHRFNLGFLAALNCVRQRTSKDGDWTGVDLTNQLPRLSGEDTEARDTEELLERFKRSGRDILEGGTKTVDEIRLTEEYLISEEELEEVEERLEDSAQELFQRLVDNAVDRERFYEIFNEEQMSSDHYRIREVLKDIGGYRIIDIRKSEMARKHAEGGSSEQV
jgi:hypothetical protein